MDVEAQPRARLLTAHAAAGQAGLPLPDESEDGSNAGPRLDRQAAGPVRNAAHTTVALAVLYAANKALQEVAPRLNFTFPPPLIGMLGIILGLLALDATVPKAAQSIDAFFNPALRWVSRWLPLFYVPSLILLPVSLTGFSGLDLVKVVAVILVGVPIVCLTTAQVAVTIRSYANTPVKPTPPAPSQTPFTMAHRVTWGAAGVFFLTAVIFSNSSQSLHHFSSAFMLAATVSGFLLGSSLPSRVTMLLHPMITTALSANAAAAVLGNVTGAGYRETVKGYLTKTPGFYGAGDWLMSFLGVVILSFGFNIFRQREIMARHAPEIFGATTMSAAVSMYSTALLGRLIGLAPELSRALIPRSVTIALALPIAAQFGTPAAIAAAGVVVTGLVGANFAQVLLNRGQFKDPIARGLATAGCAHGLGTAAIASDEPEALPFCALAYALIGVFATVLVSIPPVLRSLLAITAV